MVVFYLIKGFENELYFLKSFSFLVGVGGCWCCFWWLFDVEGGVFGEFGNFGRGF